MAKIDGIWESTTQRNRDIQKLLGVTEMLRTHTNIPRFLTGTSIVAQLAKNMYQQKKFIPQDLPAKVLASNLVNLHPRFMIPVSTFNAFKSISQQHEKFFCGVKTLLETTKIQPTSLA